MCYRLILTCILAALTTLHAGDIVITELMAENQTGLVDEDGELQDWIELYNTGSNDVDLAGWHLSNSTNNLSQWTFPSAVLPAGEFLLVFASGKNRSNATLHSSFQLDNDGEFLAVVEPDGFTISHDASYPQQYPDLSYGLDQTILVKQLIGPTAAVKYLVPQNNSLSTNWTGVGFNDAAFTSGTSGLGYDDAGKFTSYIGTDLKTAMSNVNSGVYARFPFNLTGPPSFSRMQFDHLYDDGYQAYLNGIPIASDQASASLLYNSSALQDNEGGLSIEDWGGSETAYGNYNQSGTAAATIVNNGDTFMRIAFSGIGNTKNHVHFDRTDVGPFTQVNARLDFRLLGTADGFGLSFIPTATYGVVSQGNNGAAANQAEEPNIGGAFAVGVDIYNGTDEMSLHFGSLKGEANLSGSIDLNNNRWHQMVLSFEAQPGGGTLVDLHVLPDVRGAGGAAVVFFDDFFIADMNPYEYRVQLSSRTGGQTANMDIDKISIGNAGPGGALEQSIRIDEHIPLLQDGSNVLAIHGLNHAADNRDLLIRPELEATSINPPSPASAGYFHESTPLDPNGSGTVGPAAAVIFSEPGRVIPSIEGPLMLSLSTVQTNGIIYFTTDGKVPTTNDTAYSTAIAISQNTQVRARVFAPGYSPGPVQSEHYIKLNSNVDPGQFSSNLPLVIVSNFGAGLVPNPGSLRQAGYLSIHEPGGASNRSSLTNLPSTVTRAGFRNRGSSSLNRPKKSMSLEAWNEKDLERTIQPLDLPGESDWVLYGPYNFDRALMRNTFAYELSNRMGRYAARTRYVELFLDTNGGEINYADDYWGVYMLVEELKRDKDRIDLDALGPTDNELPELSGGYIWKDDRLDSGELGFNAGGFSFAYAYPSEASITTAQDTYLKDTINAARTAVDGSNYQDPLLGYRAHIDVDAWVDHWWISAITMDVDAFVLSAFWHKPRGGKIAAGPVWDFDRSMGCDDDNRDDNPLQWNPGTTTRFFTWGWYFRLWQDPNWEQAIIDRWGELRKELMTPTNIGNTLHGYEAEIAEAAERNLTKWSAVAPNDGSFAGEVLSMETWLNQRVGFIDSEFQATPAFSHPSGPVTPGTQVFIIGSPGPVYYTTDGTDPRSPGGSIAPGAQIYAGAYTVNATTRIRARTFNAGATEYKWSAIADSTFGANVPANSNTFAITEIHYHPADPSMVETNAGYLTEDDFEFIEFENISTNVIDLAGVQFTNGISFNFDQSSVLSLLPGERTLIVRNPDAFAFRYGAIPIAGSYEGGLRDRGETLALVDAQLQVIHDFSYDDDAPWPEIADGAGPSLQVISTRGNYDSYLNWVPSAQVGGTPGTAPPEDGDADSIPDVFELFHFSSTNLVGLGDFDFDGLSDRSEFITGTSLTHGGDRLELQIVYSNQVPTVWFDSLAAEGPGYGGIQRRYRLERSPSLNPGQWTLPPAWLDVIGDGNRVIYAAPPGPKDLYRLQTWLE